MKSTQAERITALEIQVEKLIEAQKTTNEQLKASNSKLDELIALRNKGAGVFWIASTIFGTSLLALMSFILSWIRG